jgi:glycerophosphoryl diester phosphodiesterase
VSRGSSPRRSPAARPAAPWRGPDRFTRSPLRFAHRGASARAPENTLPAFEEAIRLGTDLIELDVHLSADGVPVVIHDDLVDRTTDGRGAVGALRLAALRRLDAGSWFAPRFRGARLPTLEEALDCARGRCGLNIEIKTGPPGRRARTHADPAAGVVAAVARAVARAGMRDEVLVSSFAGPVLLLLRDAMPGVRLGLLRSRSLQGLRALCTGAALYAVHPHLRLATPARLRTGHRLGLRVFVWPVNELPVMRRLIGAGADGLMSDDPALFAELDEAVAAGSAPVPHP